ncbi:MAG: TMEM14 family protein [Patescibacteria group bacterium]
MTIVWDPLYVVNLILCISIIILGFWGYKKTNSKTSLYVGIAFGLFGISHLATILGLKSKIELILIIIRTLAYLLVVYALYRKATK